MPPGLSDPKYRNPLHAIDLVRFRERSRTLTHFAAFTTADRVLATGGEPAVVNTVPVSAEMLRLSAKVRSSAACSPTTRKQGKSGSSFSVTAPGSGGSAAMRRLSAGPSSLTAIPTRSSA